MRNFLFQYIENIMSSNKKLFFLTGDTGFNLVEGIFNKYPKRSLNVGVAEQNLVGIASGLSSDGFIPIVYAITNFIVHRSFEQTRNDLCLHKRRCIMIGTSTGYDNSTLGPTHHIIDDIGSLKNFPNLTIYSPVSRNSAIKAFKKASSYIGPSFIRLTKEDFVIKKENKKIDFFYENKNKDNIILTHGRMAKYCSQAIENKNISLFFFNKVHPLDIKVLRNIFKNYKNITVVEDNFKSGLYNSICQFANELKYKHTIRSINSEFEFVDRVGSQLYFDKKYYLLPEQIIKKLNT